MCLADFAFAKSLPAAFLLELGLKFLWNSLDLSALGCLATSSEVERLLDSERYAALSLSCPPSAQASPCPSQFCNLC